MMLLPSEQQARRLWLTADPFPHLVVPDAIYPDEAAAIGAEYPAPDDPAWKTYSGPLEQGKQEGPTGIAGPLTAAMHRYLATPEFVGWLRAVSGISDLIADPARVGGGIHQAALGARLGMHVDFNVHPAIVDPFLLRAVNVILFVGDASDLYRYEEVNGRIKNVGGWRPAWGGYLTLGEGPGGPDIMPEPGTLVAFAASDDSWHGHPVPMQANPTTGHEPPLRRSIPAYYYRPLLNGETAEPHSTRFLEVERGRCPHKTGAEVEVLDTGRCALCGGIVD